MKMYTVTLSLITGYNDNELNDPKLKYVETTLYATSEAEAIAKAKELDHSKYSVYESYAYEA